VADNLAFKVVTLAVLTPTWILVAYLTEPRFTTTFAQLGLGIMAQVLAMMINFVWGYTAALISFWTTRNDHVGELWMGLSLFVGGRLAPLTILPAPMQGVAAVLPFKWAIWFPSAALIGRLTATEIAWGLLWQSCWLIAGIVAFRLLWRAGVKRHSAVGG
jgi:ABC-2 type transport system permease protein